MTKTPIRIAAIALSALMTLAVVAGVNGIAASQYASADALVTASAGQAHVALQRVVIIGRRANA
jgi:hypothetical protein